MVTLTFRPLTLEDARAVLAWRYPPPYDVYNFDTATTDADLRYLVDPANQFHAILDEQDAVVGFCSFGADAQVPGGDYSEAALDIGMGIRPDLTGRGHGTTYACAVLRYAIERFNPQRVRVTIAAFNRRARRVWENLAFRKVSAFRNAKNGRAFVILALTDPKVLD